jgi:hypothetical protein
MKRYGSELEFLFHIVPDGSEVRDVKDEQLEAVNSDMFELNRLSISEDTYIASGFNSFVVKLKNPPRG